MDEKLTVELTVQFGSYSQTELAELKMWLEKLLARKGQAAVRGLLAPTLQELYTATLARLDEITKKGASNGNA
jgi:hypothetical protein